MNLKELDIQIWIIFTLIYKTKSKYHRKSKLAQKNNHSEPRSERIKNTCNARHYPEARSYIFSPPEYSSALIAI